jgi:hypothetical protein
MLKCPAFQQNLPFLRYILQYAVYVRVGKGDGGPPPEMSNKVDELLGRMMELVLDGIPKDSDSKKLRSQMKGQIPKKKKILNHEHGDGSQPHIRFIKFVKEESRIGWHATSKGIILKDLEVILKAWDKYVPVSGFTNLLTIKDAKMDIPTRLGPRVKGKENTMASSIQSFDLKVNKKAYILHIRREVLKTKRTWRRGKADLYGEAVVKGEVYASIRLPQPQLNDAPTDERSIEAMLRDTAPEDTAPEDMATEDTATEDTATEDMATEDTATEDTAIENMAPADSVLYRPYCIYKEATWRRARSRGKTTSGNQTSSVNPAG